MQKYLLPLGSLASSKGSLCNHLLSFLTAQLAVDDIELTEEDYFVSEIWTKNISQMLELGVQAKLGLKNIPTTSADPRDSVMSISNGKC